MSRRLAPSGVPVALVFALASVVVLWGCHQGGRSIVRVHVVPGTADEGLLATVQISVKQADKLVREPASFDWMRGGISGGVYLPAEISGEVRITAAGLSVHGDAVADSDVGVDSVTPGQNTIRIIELTLRSTSGNNSDGGSMGGAAGGTDAGAGGMGAGGRGAGGVGVGGMGVGGGMGGVVLENLGGRGAGGSGSGGAAVPDGGSPDVPVVGRSWQTAGLAENDTDAVTRPQVVVDASGNALVVYEHGSVIWFNRYSISSGTWGIPGPLSGSTTGTNLRVAIDGQGVATVIWEQAPLTTPRGIWTSTATSATTWSAPALLSSGNAFDAHLAVSPATSGAAVGTAIAVWTENNGLNTFVAYVSSRPNAGGAWTAKAMLTPVGTDGNFHFPSLTMDGAGNGFVTWEQGDPADSGQRSVYVARFSAGAFGAGMAIESFAGGAGADSSSVALNASGAGVATWRQANISNADLYSRFYVGGGWGPPQLIANATVIATVRVPHVAIDPGGNATAVWAQSVASNTEQARLARHAAGATSWDAPIMLETDNQLNGDTAKDPSPELGLDDAGNAMVIWRKQAANGIVDLWSRRVSASGVVEGPALIDNQNDYSVFGHQLAVAPNGVAVAVWYYASVFDIWSAVFR